MKKTSEEWQNDFIDYVTVIDPDGWDRKNFQFSWYEELITKEEWISRTYPSTIIAQIDWEDKIDKL